MDRVLQLAIEIDGAEMGFGEFIFGSIFAGMGLLLIYAIIHTHRRSVSQLPNDASLIQRWGQLRLTPMPQSHWALKTAAARVKQGSVHNGHHLLGLPASSGVRVCATSTEPREWFVGDVWNVTSTTSTNDKTTGATVQVRAVGALPLERPAPRVIVGRENALTLLADAAGLRDVQLEGELFNRTFRVKAESREDAYAVLTPQVMQALEQADGRFALEIGGGLLTLTEISGIDGDPAGGQVGALHLLVPLMQQIIAGTRPHTWPEAADDWSKQERKWERVVVDQRPPGAVHPKAGNAVTGAIVGFVVGASFAAFGFFMMIAAVF